MGAQLSLYPGTSASFLCPCPCADDSGDGGDGDELFPDSALVLLRTGPPQSVPGCTSSAHPPGGASASAKMLSV